MVVELVNSKNRRQTHEKLFLVEHKADLTEGVVFEVKLLLTHTFFCQTIIPEINILSYRGMTSSNGAGMATKKAPGKAQKAAGSVKAAAQGGGKLISVRFGADLNEQLQAIADARDMTASAVVRTAVEMYLQREQFAVALSDVETNIASTLNAARRDTAKVAEDIQLIVAIMDQFVKFSMIAAPEVVDKEGAVALGNRRYAGFVAELHKAFHTRRKKAVLTQTLEGMGSEQSYG